MGCAVFARSEVIRQHIRPDRLSVQFRDADPKTQEHSFNLMMFALIDREAT